MRLMDSVRDWWWWKSGDVDVVEMKAMTEVLRKAGGRGEVKSADATTSVT